MKANVGSHMEAARSFSFLSKAPSYASSTANVLWTVFFGYLASLRTTISPLVFVFVAASKLFSIGLTENKDASLKTRIYSTIAFGSLVPLLIGRSSFEITIGILILALYSLYPVCNGKAPFDVLHHALRYVFIFILGFGSLPFFNQTAMLALSAIVLFSVAGEFLAGLEKSESSRSAASRLGTKPSLTIIILSIFTASIMASIALNNMFEFPIQVNQTLIPFYLLPALALDAYIAKSLMNSASKENVDSFRLIRKKQVIVIAAALLLILVVFQTARISTIVDVHSRNYSFDVNIRTVIAGKLSWNVPWIVFNYVNESNYYYVVFHTDGVLELSQKTDGQYLRYISSIETPLTPFQWHTFHITLNETTVTVRLDEEYQLTASRHLVTDTSSIVISPSTPKGAGVWIAAVYSISINTQTQS